MADALAELKTRLEQIQSLGAISSLLVWDQRTIMPPAGASNRGSHLALLQELAHEALIDPEVGRLIDELRPLEESLDPDSDDAALIRLAGREYDKAVRVPAELAGEMARAASEAAPIWLEAKMTSNFELFLPALERAVELRRRYIACFDPTDQPYDILLDDFEPETKSADVTRIFAEIKAELVPMIAELRQREVDDSFLTGDFPIEPQIELGQEIVDLFGHRPDTWRIDPTEHPFASGTGVDDIRVTTHYYPDSLESVFSTMHEYGHGLYQHQIRRDIAHLPIGNASSLGIHESQSRLWENLVGRAMPFWRFFYPRLQSAFPGQLGGVDLDTFYAAINKVQPSLIRIRADEVTYGMHVILRFELEQDIVNGTRRAERPAADLERADVRLPRHRGSGRRERRAPGRALVGRADRLLLHVPARHGHVRAAVGEDRRGRARSRRPDRARRVRCAARLARRERARARAQVPAAGDAATSRRLDHRREAVSRVPEAQVRRRGSRVAAGLR